ncbi:hypothetical protein PTNB85_03785 [Pyrenophora teres f. teres]|uniref:Neutral protease 2 n=1 Tax=Pyrenophora teres f. teres TaxID=97479 RepID=A0A6S6W1E0_9PLEO|nr:hypothetical protein HRS9139_05661 [Pyrenophora teres f. teres]KAE8840386.1 hypothetical protein PTNB85_03785 [Pyrenophora teres f. teres]KAE8863885.1 hypothetical protein PTNB29_03849 [Pyrenophora teres f. teres]CAE7033841.1 Peptidase M35 multi-domain protein [Pyrenophora teres f. teres]
MKSLYTLLVALAAGATAVTTPIDLKLSSVGGSRVKVTITNTNQDTGYNILKVNTVLEDFHTKRLTITNGGTEVDFTGITGATYIADELDEESFFPLLPGQTREVVIDVAEGYWVHKTDTSRHDIIATGWFHYAALNSTQIVKNDGFPYTSNTLSIDIDQAEAKIVFDKYTAQKLAKRVDISSTCEGSEITKLKQALMDCKEIAHNAAEDVREGTSSYYSKYFFRLDWQEVKGRLEAISSHCGSLGVFDAVIYCRDPYTVSRCTTRGVAAYSRDKDDTIVLCPAYFQLPGIRRACNGYTSGSMAGAMIHELTHMSRVYTPICSDYAYGSARSARLCRDYATGNADSYALYAMDLFLGCLAL